MFLSFDVMANELREHIISAATEGKRHFMESQSKIQQRIQQKERKVQKLKTAVETIKSSAQTAIEDCERIFIEMISLIERRRCEVKQLIRGQEKAEVSRAERLLRRLEQEIAELNRRDAAVVQPSYEMVYTQIHKTSHSIGDQPQPKDHSCSPVNQDFSEKSSFTSEQQLEDFSNKKEIKISEVSDVQAVLPEPMTKEEFLLYFTCFTLDPNTAYRDFHLSEENRKVEWGTKCQSHPDHPERFDWPQVLSREGVSGRCYWEVEWSGENAVDIAVSYKNISRKGGQDCVFGGNNQSWSLTLFGSSASFRHNNKETKLPLVASSRIGVYLDHRAGTLAFYSISDTMTLLHRIQTIFTHTLYPGFLVGFKSSVKLL